uniref:PDZ domain-containing protein n=1 Tax=Alexandrium catenella TaxID=2925 RepID=A0A7S1S7M9_ALECA
MGGNCCKLDDDGRPVVTSECHSAREDCESSLPGDPAISDYVGSPQRRSPRSLPSDSEDTPRVRPGEMTVGFRLPNGTQREVAFTKRPLGVDFHRSSPIMLKRVHEGSQGQLMGVQAGWEVYFIDGIDVRGKDFHATYDLLKRGCGRLGD